MLTFNGTAEEFAERVQPIIMRSPHVFLGCAECDAPVKECGCANSKEFMISVSTAYFIPMFAAAIKEVCDE